MPSPHTTCPLKSILMVTLNFKAHSPKMHHLPRAWTKWRTFHLPWASGAKPTWPGMICKFRLLVSNTTPVPITPRSRGRIALTFSKAAKSTWAWPVTSTTAQRERERRALRVLSCPLPQCLFFLKAKSRIFRENWPSSHLPLPGGPCLPLAHTSPYLQSSHS